MKKIKIYIGNIETAFQESRNELARFVQGLNNRYVDNNIYIEIMPLTIEKMVEMKRKGSTTDYIKDSDFTFFLFFETVENGIEEELDFAVKHFQQTGAPKIFTCFQIHKNEDNKITSIKKKIDEKIQHFYEQFHTIDTIKLRLLLTLNKQNHNTMQLRFENSCLFEGDELVMSLENIPLVSQNNELHRLKKCLQKITLEHEMASEEFSKNIENEELFFKVSKLAEEKENLENAIFKHENILWNLIQNMHLALTKGKIDDLRKKAYRCLEQGDIEGADAILDIQKLNNIHNLELETIKNNNTLNTERSKNVIDLYKDKIAVQKAKGESSESIKIIRECYEQIHDIILESHYGYETILEYANFLYELNDMKAIDLYKEAEWFYDNPNLQEDAKQLVYIYSDLAVFHDRQRDQEAEKYYEKSYHLSQKLYSHNPEKYSGCHAHACNNMGNLFLKKDTKEAGLYYKKALEITEKLCKKNPKKYGENYAKACYGIGNFLDIMGDPKSAKEAYTTSLQICETLHKEYPHKHSSFYGFVLQRAGLFFEGIGDEQTAEDNYKKSLSIYEDLYNKLPEKYGSSYADINKRLGSFYASIQNILDAKEKYEKSMSIYEALYGINPQRYAKAYALINRDISLFYDTYIDKELGIKHYNKSMQIIDALQSKHSELYSSILVDMDNLASLYYAERGDFESAINSCKKSYDATNALYEQNSILYGGLYAEITCNLAGLYADIDQKEAGRLYNQSFKTASELYEKSPLKYGVLYCSICNNIAVFFENTGNIKGALEKYETARKVIGALHQTAPKQFEDTYHGINRNLQAFYSRIGYSPK